MHAQKCSKKRRTSCRIPSSHRLDIILDTLIPSYINDHDILSYLAHIPDPFTPLVQPSRVIIGPALPKNGLPLVPYGDDEEEDDEVREIQGPIHATLAKRRSRKLKEPLDDVFLRQRKRLNPDMGGFRTEESVAAAAENQDFYVESLEVIHPIYASSTTAGSSSPLAPHLPVETIQSMAIGFLQMQPSAISASALLERDDNDNEM